MKLLTCYKYGKKFLCRLNKECEHFIKDICSCMKCYDNHCFECEEIQMEREKVVFT